MVERVIAKNKVSFAGASKAPDSGTTGYFRDYDVENAIPATVFPAYVLNMLLDELVNILVKGHVTPSGQSWQQCWQGILGVQSFVDHGLANHIVVNPPNPLTVETLVRGMEITVDIAAANTSTVDLTYQPVDEVGFG